MTVITRSSPPTSSSTPGSAACRIATGPQSRPVPSSKYKLEILSRFTALPSCVMTHAIVGHPLSLVASGGVVVDGLIDDLSVPTAPPPAARGGPVDAPVGASPGQALYEPRLLGLGAPLNLVPVWLRRRIWLVV